MSADVIILPVTTKKPTCCMLHCGRIAREAIDIRDEFGKPGKKWFCAEHFADMEQTLQKLVD